jgi:PAS domain S-box-containing protein
MVNSIRDYAIFALDPEGRVATWNEAATRVKGWRAEQVIGRSYAMFHTEEDQAAGKPDWELREAVRHGLYEEEGMRVRGDGSLFPARISLSPMRDPEGRVAGFVKVIENITQRTRRDEELRQLRDGLERSVEERTLELRAALDQLETFSYSISHDLRTPLRAMEGFSSILLQDYGPSLDERGRHYLERIAAAARRMDRLVQDVLALSRLQRARLATHDIDLDRLVPEVVAQYDQLREGAAEIVVEGPLLPVHAHEPSLVQCLSNLLTNAVKFARDGVTPRIRISTEPVGRDSVRVVVGDNGVGVRPEDRERIFRLFEQVKGPRSGDGTGVGLAIVKTAAERMGGEAGLDDDNAQGEGSRFFIQLPAAHGALSR